MNNFGVIELASAKTTSAPGWAYVPDTGSTGASAIQPSNRKRARATTQNLSLGDLTARQEALLRKDVEALDRDSNKDASIPLPAKSGRAQGKHTPNVRKILQSQKTFTNHLDDFLAMQALTDGNVAAATGNSRPNANAGTAIKRPKDTTVSAAQAKAVTEEDVQMTDAEPPVPQLPPLLPGSSRPPPAPHPLDREPLLVSRVPEVPTDDELRRLLARAPLAYVEAHGEWDERYPRRVFCAVCGYWGRVRCMKCGTRICALDCLEMHREECVTRYGL